VRTNVFPRSAQRTLQEQWLMKSGAVQLKHLVGVAGTCHQPEIYLRRFLWFAINGCDRERRALLLDGSEESGPG